jgi:hypothetical protein
MLEISKTWRTLFHLKLQCWKFQKLEELSFTSNFNVGNFKNLKNSLSHFWTWNLKLKDLKNILPHLRTYNTLKKSLPHLPPTWKSYKLLVCHHLEMNSHSRCKVKNLVSKQFSPFFLCNTSSNLSLLFILTQCPFSCLVWAHNLLETTWKLARNESFNNCIN